MSDAHAANGNLILVRHGQSEWNLQDRFTGWVDVDLTEAGKTEAQRAGAALAAHGVRFDCCYASVLRRAVRTAWLVQEASSRMWVPLLTDWRLNERHYGALQGLNKTETAAKFGAAKVRDWRRSYAIQPPLLSPEAAREAAADPRYAGVDPSILPVGESLRDTEMRVMDAWEARIAPDLRAGRRVLIAAHGNSLRALVKRLEDLDERAVEALEIATGRAIVYRLDAGLRPAKKMVL